MELLVGKGMELVCGLTPKMGTKLCSYELAFDCNINMAKYAALILGLNTLK